MYSIETYIKIIIISHKYIIYTHRNIKYNINIQYFWTLAGLTIRLNISL